MNLFYSSFSYVMLSSSKFFSLLKIIYLVFFSPKLIESILSINHLHLFADSFLKNIFNFHNILMLIKKMLVFSACRCMWLSDRACRISFVYSKKKDKGTNIDPWGTPQFSSYFWKHIVQWNEKKLCLWGRMKPFYCFIGNTDAPHFV